MRSHLPPLPAPCIYRGEENLRLWPSFGKKIVLIEIKGAEVILRTGHISSFGRATHVGVNPKNEVVVWMDHQVRDADSADDAHEKVCAIKDPHFLHVEEARLLRKQRALSYWFHGKYPSQTLRKIRVALERLQAA